MRFSVASLIAVSLLLAGLPAAVSGATPSSPPSPSCAAGPTTIGGTTYGTPCADVIVVPSSVEAVQGGAGDDTIVPGPITAISSCTGEDCYLGVGSQTFDGGPGDDVVYGQRGNDTLRGGGGRDQLFGGIGDDVLSGGPGDDLLAGGFGADAIDGDEGNDYVHGDGTIDRIRDTGGGTDTLSYATGITPGFGAGIDVDYDDFPPAAEGRGVNLVLGVGGENDNNGVASFGGGVDEVAVQSFETIVGTPFSDYIVGSASAETIYGGGGADVILGEGGNDSLFGNADGDDLDGGADADSADGGPGEDHCQGAAGETSCESATAAVDPRDPTKVSVGLMTPGAGTYSQLYLAGSNGIDVGTVTYSGASVSFALAAGAFDQSADAAAGCTVATATQATCPLNTQLDSIVLAGMGGNDNLTAAGFPSSVTVMMLGGDGGDSLNGGTASEDVLVDGPDAGGDALAALGGDDALLHNDGPDQLLGGDGNDLFLSVSICDSETLRGEAGRDNSSWARLKSQEVGASLGSGKAGEPGVDGAPECGGSSASSLLDSMQEIEDLEGSESGDSFYGDAGPNQLLGHKGPDTYSAAAGADTILANSGDLLVGDDDPVIDCGDDVDRALVDHPEYGADATPVNCEAVSEADPNSFQLLPDFPVQNPPSLEPTVPDPPTTSVPKPPIRPVRDRTPPRTRILARPHAVLIATQARRRVAFRFAANEPGSSFRCKLDRAPYRPCASPRAYSLAPGRHKVRIFAVDRSGNADPTPALLSVQVRRR